MQQAHRTRTYGCGPGNQQHHAPSTRRRGRQDGHAAACRHARYACTAATEMLTNTWPRRVSGEQVTAWARHLHQCYSMRVVQLPVRGAVAVAGLDCLVVAFIVRSLSGDYRCVFSLTWRLGSCGCAREDQGRSRVSGGAHLQTIASNCDARSRGRLSVAEDVRGARCNGASAG